MLKLEQVYWNAPGGTPILKGVDLTIPDGKLLAITGPNGGGKTTVAKLIAGLVKPDKGRILLDDEDITELDITQRAKRGISYAFQQPVRFKGLTVRDIMEFAAGNSLKEEALCEILSKVGLCAQDYMDREVDASLSGGEIKRIEIATVLARHTRVTVFDEPEAGIDLWSFTGLIDVFEKMRHSLKSAMAIISHQERILSIADEIAVIEGGRVKIAGPGNEILPGLLTDQPGCPVCPRGKEALHYE